MNLWGKVAGSNPAVERSRGAGLQPRSSAWESSPIGRCRFESGSIAVHARAFDGPIGRAPTLSAEFR